MGLTRYEQETIIVWNEEEAQAEIYTASPLVAARLKKLGLTPYREEGPGRFYKVSRGAVRIKVGNRSVHIAGGQPEEAPKAEEGPAADAPDEAPDVVFSRPAEKRVCKCGREFTAKNKKQVYCDLCAGQRKVDRSKEGMAKIRKEMELFN